MKLQVIKFGEVTKGDVLYHNKKQLLVTEVVYKPEVTVAAVRQLPCCEPDVTWGHPSLEVSIVINQNN
jgi:hypothetical protein